MKVSNLGLWTLAAVSLLPVVAIFWEISSADSTNWNHFVKFLLGDYLAQTAIFCSLVVCGAGFWGAAAAYCMAFYDFWGKSFWRWGLVLPLAMPGYIVSYAYAAICGPGGWVELPVINIWGCSAIMSWVLYPYVYLIVKPHLEVQAGSYLEAAHMLGLSRRRALLRVVLPMARPGFFAGLSLVAMEALNEYGAVRYFGVGTLTVGLFRAWNAMDDRGIAARVALLLLLAMLGLVALERYARSRSRYSATKARPIAKIRLHGLAACSAIVVCAFPFAMGFLVPFAGLALWAWQTVQLGVWPEHLTQSALTSLGLGAAGAIVVAVVSLFAAYHRKGWFSQLALSGYAIPGAVLAMGIVVMLARVEKPLPVLISGSYFALMYGYVVRFLAVGYSPIEAGWQKISPSFAEAASLLGKTSWQTWLKIQFPLLKGSFGAASVLLFVEIFKELPLTLVLRPFGFHSLATRAFELAGDEQLAQAAIPAVLIAAISILPVVWLIKKGGETQ